VLHRWEATNVALAGGVLHVMPAGVFQPSTVLPSDQADDFDLWRNQATSSLMKVSTLGRAHCGVPLV